MYSTLVLVLHSTCTAHICLLYKGSDVYSLIHEIQYNYSVFPDEAHIPSVAVPDPPVVAPDSLVDFSLKPPDIINPFPSSPFNEQVEDEQVEDELPNPNPELGPLLLLHLKILHKKFHLIT